MAFSDVLLPIAPFTETPGTFVNAEGRVQSFHAVVKPLGETRPAWKVLRVLGNMLGLPGFAFESCVEVLAQVFGPAVDGLSQVAAGKLSNASDVLPAVGAAPASRPAVASIYQLDSLVRRATSLQLTADARQGAVSQEQEVSA
jgi:NADH-quinone oxidoreductase subunit G